MPTKPIILSGTSNTGLVQKVAKASIAKLGTLDIEKFADGETYINITENLKDKKPQMI